MNLLALLRDRFAAALRAMDIDAADVPGLAEMVLPSQDARFGDYQANCAMPLGKRLGKPPRDVAKELVERLDVGELCEPPEIAGPGFINLRLRRRLACPATCGRQPGHRAAWRSAGRTRRGPSCWITHRPTWPSRCMWGTSAPR